MRRDLEPAIDWRALNRDGFCNCGCGERTSIAKQTDHKIGHIRGEHTFFLAGHSRRANYDNLPFEERDTGYETPCHLWTKRRTTKGYASWGDLGGQRNELVHRAVWEKANGPAPEGWTIHHKCRTRHCVRVDHLEALPHYAHEQAQLTARFEARQAQDSLTDQMLRVALLADQAGEYDAADWLRRHFSARGVA